MNPSSHLVTGATDGIGLQTALEKVLWEKSMEMVGGGVE